MRHFIMVNTLHIPRENQLRAAAVLEHVLQTKGQILGFGRALMAGRWARLRTCFATASRLALQPLEPAAHDAFSGADDYAPSPAYAWVRQLDGGDATATLRDAGVVGRPGDAYGANESFVRLELLMREATFDVMIDKLCRLVK